MRGGVSPSLQRRTAPETPGLRTGGWANTRDDLAGTTQPLRVRSKIRINGQTTRRRRAGSGAKNSVSHVVRNGAIRGFRRGSRNAGDHGAAAHTRARPGLSCAISHVPWPQISSAYCFSGLPAFRLINDVTWRHCGNSIIWRSTII